MSDSDQTIRRQLATTFLGDQSLYQFSVWFTTFSWNPKGSANDTGLVRDIELLLAEYTNGHRTDEEVQQRFVELATGYVVAGRVGETLAMQVPDGVMWTASNYTETAT